MTWAKLDDGFWSHPKVIAAGNEAVGVYCRALTYCTNHLTDGFVPADALKIIAGKGGPITRLVDVGLLGEAEGGYRIPDFLDFNPSRSDVQADRDQARERMQRVRANKRNGSGEHAPNFTRSSPEVRLTPTRPDPNVPSEHSHADDFTEWLGHYQTTTGKTSVRGSKLARREFNARRKDFSLADLKLATAGVHSDDYLRERGFDMPETILRESKVERYIELGRKAARGKSDSSTSGLTLNDALAAKRERLAAQGAS